MPYILAAVVIAIAVVLGIFTGIWGGLVWIVAAGVVVGVIFAVRARATEVNVGPREPTGTPRGTGGSAGTANRRVGRG